MISFNQLWQLFASRGALASQYAEAEQLWTSYSPDQQQQIYNAFRTTLERGAFVHYNPSQAIRENARTRHLGEPTTSSGRPHPKGYEFFRATYNGQRGLYTAQDVQTYHMSSPEIFEL